MPHFYETQREHIQIIKKCANVSRKLSPKNVTETQQFLILVQYMSPFIPCLSESTQPLRALLHKDVEWQWTSSHEQSFIKLKNAIHEDLTSRYFDTISLSDLKLVAL